MNSLCNGGAAKKGAALYFTLWKVPSWLYTHSPPAPQYASEPVPPPVCRHSARCEGCPYPAHGFLCWSSDSDCLRTRMEKIYAKEKNDADQNGAL